MIAKSAARFEKMDLDRYGEFYDVFMDGFAKKCRRPEYLGEIYMFKICFFEK